MKNINEIIKICSTEDFYKAMCSFSFVRIDLYSGVDDDKIYLTSMPPELKKGFLEKQVNLAIKDLYPEQKTIWTKFKKKFLKRRASHENF